MSRRAVAAVFLVLTCILAGCADSPPSASNPPASTAALPVAETTPAVTSTDTATTRLDAVAGEVEAREECENFTIELDRWVFIRLRPVVENANDLLHSRLEAVDPSGVAAGLEEAASRIRDLVEDLDLMGVPPRQVIELFLSIRASAIRYAAGFEQGAHGWDSGHSDLIDQAKDGVEEASGALTEFFGRQLCG